MQDSNVINSYKDLIVWQKAIELVLEIYKITEHLPSSEQYGLIAQMRRAAISIPSNIAEGRRRGSMRDFRQFLIIAYSSGAELETQLEITKKLNFGKSTSFSTADKLLDEIMRMLNKMINRNKSLVQSKKLQSTT